MLVLSSAGLSGCGGGGGGGSSSSNGTLRSSIATFTTGGTIGTIPIEVQIGSLTSNPTYVSFSGSTTSTVTYNTNSSIFLTVPVNYGNRVFDGWQESGLSAESRDAASYYSTDPTLNLTASQLSQTASLTPVYSVLAPDPVNGFTPNYLYDFTTFPVTVATTGTNGSPGTETQTQYPHWASFPVNVYFVSTIDTADESSIQVGLSRWVTASGSVISYNVVTDPTLADISIGYGVTPTGYAGYTSSYWDGNYNLIGYHNPDLTNPTHVVTIALNSSNIGNVQNLSTIAAHEFGHALGLIVVGNINGGHSTVQTDTMFKSGNTSVGLITARDMNTMSTNYVSLFSPNTGKSSLANKRTTAVGPIHHGSAQ